VFPITSTQQPFGFVALPASDQSTLQAAFQSALYRNTGVQMLERYDSAGISPPTSRGKRPHWHLLTSGFARNSGTIAVYPGGTIQPGRSIIADCSVTYVTACGCFLFPMFRTFVSN
jgi:hypothetical protein